MPVPTTFNLAKGVSIPIPTFCELSMSGTELKAATQIFADPKLIGPPL